jgi:hypothetical protein
MALRGVLTHRKTRRLAKLLHVDQCAALGILEALWHVTAENQPDGGVGRMKNADIAEEMFCDRDGDELINALVKSGWVDDNPASRLYVHDWHQHADDTIQSKLIQWTRLFANGEPPRLTKISKDSRPKIITRFEDKYGEVIGQIMRSVRTEHDSAHRAHDGHYQSQSQSQSQNPEDERDGRVDSQLQEAPATEPPPPVRPPSKPQSEIPSKPVVPAVPTAGHRNHERIPPVQIPSKLMDRAFKPSPPRQPDERIENMRNGLHSLMQQWLPDRPPRPCKPPDDAIVVRCLMASGSASTGEVTAFLRELVMGYKLPEGGPRSYAWFEPVLRERFGGMAS